MSLGAICSWGATDMDAVCEAIAEVIEPRCTVSVRTVLRGAT